MTGNYIFFYQVEIVSIISKIWNSHEESDTSMFSVFGATVLKWPWNPKQNMRVAVAASQGRIKHKRSSERSFITFSDPRGRRRGADIWPLLLYWLLVSALRGQRCEWWAVFILTTETLPSSSATLPSNQLHNNFLTVGVTYTQTIRWLRCLTVFLLRCQLSLMPLHA